jgi:hypothetical protein
VASWRRIIPGCGGRGGNDASSFAADHGADVSYDLPLHSLAAGSYLLSMRTTLDARTSVERDVR